MKKEIKNRTDHPNYIDEDPQYNIKVDNIKAIFHHHDEYQAKTARGMLWR